MMRFFISGFVTGVTRRMPLVEQELPAPLQHLLINLVYLLENDTLWSKILNFSIQM